jgi:TonB-linked SusC/RagA family outer membrane protein
MSAYQRLHILLLCASLFLFGFTALAQPIVKGKIENETGSPLQGATIQVKGKAAAQTTTAKDGSFSIAANASDILLISYVGYEPIEVTSGAANTIVLKSDSRNMNEVVVTALGIKKETRRLGYSVQEVKGAELIKAREPNALNGLVGKVAGLTVGISSELLGRPALLLRGSNIGFFVVDGVPINSDTWNVNPDDIESVTVLKGPTASALYGYRGQNGAIAITTKKGRRNGTSIEFNSSTMFERGFVAIPRVQDEYGPGDHGRYAFVDGKGGGLNDGDYDVWGPKFEGQMIPQYDSPIDPATGQRTATPWLARGKHNLQRFLETGLLSTNNIAVSTSTEKSDLRFSLSHTYQKGIVPNTRLNSSFFNLSNTVRFTDRLKFESNINYNRQYTDNVPDVIYGPNSVIYNMTLWGGADWDVRQMRNYWQPGKEGVQSIYAEYQRYHNPYFMSYEWLRGHYKNDLYGYASLSYKILNNLELMGRTSVTTYDLTRNEKMPFSAHPYGREEGRGDYREDKRSMFENNTEMLLSYTNNNQLFDGFGVKASVGGNIRNWNYRSSFTTTDYLNVPGVYNFANSRNPVKVYNFDADMRVLSAYGFVDLNYRSYINLSVTGRTDKLSTLPQGNNTYFYPSASVSTIVSDYVPMPRAISMLKLKGSVANVKGGLTQAYSTGAAYPLGYGQPYSTVYEGPTYQNSAVYTTPLLYNNQPGAFYTNQINNPELRPFSRTSYEGGAEIRFLKNRLGFDATYFIYNDGPGIFSRDVSQTTGYTSALVNGIETQRKGWEISLTGNVLRNANGLNWDVLANWSTFKEELVSIYEGVNQLSSRYFIGDNRGDRFNQIGERVDAIYGGAFARTPEGQLINDAGGRPIALPKGQLLGYANPDWVWAVNNKFSYKNIGLSFQFDGRVGGELVNYVQRQTFRGGRHIATVQGAMGEARYQDYKGVKSWVGEGVVVSSGTIQYDPVTGQITNYKDLQFAPNTTKTYLQDYISRYYQQEEFNIVSKTFSKLREVTLSYNLPVQALRLNFVKQASLSFVGRNLLYFSKVKDIDLDQYPGGAAYSTLQTPTTRRYGVNLNVTF